MDLKEAKFKKSENRHPWELARLDIVHFFMKEKLETLNKNGGSVLDMGCGDTWFIEQLSARYPKIQFVAVDIAFTDALLAELKAKYQGTTISVYESLDKAQEGQKQAFDAVLLLDVIEHIEKEIDFLKWMQTFACIDGSTEFVITVPAYQWLFSAHDVFLDHYRRYNNQLLIDHTSQAGLKHKQIGYFFFSLFLARILVKIKESIAGQKNYTTGLVEWTGGSFVTNSIKTVLMIDFYFCHALRKIGIRIPGLSNYMICKKSA